MKSKIIKKIKLDDAQAFFCFHNRMCNQNRRYSLEDLKKKRSISSGSAILVKKSNSFLLAAFLTAEHSEPIISVALENNFPELRLELFYDGAGEVPDEKILVQEFNTLPEALSSLKNELTAKDKKFKPPTTGWCSWYHYFAKITEKDVLENLPLAASGKFGPLEYFQIDMGFCTKLGDWTTPNANFPNGIDKIPAKIKAAGLIPGIWLAPFTAETDSELYQQHPDWFHAEDSYIWKPVFNAPPWKALDLSHPEAFEFVLDLGRTFSRMGFEYFKLDFLDMGVIPGKRFSNEKSGVALYRQALSEFRRIVNAPVLACNPLIPASYDIVDGIRINQDTAPFWHAKAPDTAGAEEALMTAFTRLFLNDGPLEVDPDCICLRNSQTDLTDDEVETYVNITKVSNGAFFLSDDLSLVSGDRIIAAFRKLPYDHISAYPADLFDNDPPCRLSLYKNDTDQVGELIVNWQDTVQEFQLTGKFRQNFNTGEKIKGDSITLRPHQSVVLFRKKNTA